MTLQYSVLVLKRSAHLPVLTETRLGETVNTNQPAHPWLQIADSGAPVEVPCSPYPGTLRNGGARRLGHAAACYLVAQERRVMQQQHAGEALRGRWLEVATMNLCGGRTGDLCRGPWWSRVGAGGTTVADFGCDAMIPVACPARICYCTRRAHAAAVRPGTTGYIEGRQPRVTKLQLQRVTSVRIIAINIMMCNTDNGTRCPKSTAKLLDEPHLARADTVYRYACVRTCHEVTHTHVCRATTRCVDHMDDPLGCSLCVRQPSHHK